MLLALLMLINQMNQPIPSDAQLVRLTCYTWTGNRTASGVYPEEGMCASNWEHMGQIAFIYDLDMNLIDSYLVTDVGGHPSLVNGTSIDIYRDTLPRCYSYISEYGTQAYVKWVDLDEILGKGGENDD